MPLGRDRRRTGHSRTAISCRYRSRHYGLTQVSEEPPNRDNSMLAWYVIPDNRLRGCVRGRSSAAVARSMPGGQCLRLLVAQ